jgi:hypothetical protein
MRVQDRFALNSLGFIVAAALLAACAETRTAAPTLTSADVPAAHGPTPETLAAPPADEAPPASAPAALPTPPGRRACKATSPFGVKSELFLEWSGETATGVLRSVAPTGVVTDKKVTAARHDGTILVDDALHDDLVSHVAFLRTLDGAPYLRFSDETGWLRCE